eukprot:gene18856-25408_t
MWTEYCQRDPSLQESRQTAAQDPNQDPIGAVTEPATGPVTLIDPASRNLWQARLWPII